MPRYLLIESRDPFDSNDTGFCRDLATQLAATNHEVTLFLVQNGVLPARTGARSGDLAKLAGAGVRVLADSFSLKERGIDEEGLAAGVTAEKNGGKIDWVNCGLCVDERGAAEAIPGVRRGSPADFWNLSEASDNTLVIATR